ncbi:MAG: HAD family hydrolase [Rhodospirillales bacterium]|nr:HAD family hydrolase [Rhodospirillales bacterium]
MHPVPGMAAKAVFLDRDGILNRALIHGRKSYAPRMLADFRLLPGVTRAVRELHRAGFLLVVVTNQPDIGNGLVAPEVVEEMHRRLRGRLPLTEIMVCPHRQDEGCPCRKPRPGMLVAAAGRFGIDLRRSWMVGDRPSDVEAGLEAGCRTIFVDRHGFEPCIRPAHAQAGSLPAAAAFILADAKEAADA